MPRLTTYMPGMAAPLSPFLAQAGRFKQAIDLVVLYATRVNDLATARFAIDEEVVDLVGMTRGHIADPYIIAKLQNGEEDRIRSCVDQPIVPIMAIASRTLPRRAKANCPI